MKILFFLVAIANIALFMWEYKTGAFVPATETSEQNTDLDQEQILLVSELINAPEPITLAPVPEQPAAENASTVEADKLAVVPESLSTIPESIDKPVLDKLTIRDLNIIDADKIKEQETPLADNASTVEADKQALVPDSLPAVSENIDKPALEKFTASDSNISDADKIEERCYEVGPFANDKAYRAWVNRLQDIKSEIKPIHRDEQIVFKYMVYYPAAETELESKDNIKMLKMHGIKDLWPLSDEDKGKISLGLFIKEQNALVMKNELLAKGINAEVKARYKTKSQKYALIKGDDKLMTRLGDLIKTNPELALKQISDGPQRCW
jgi:hypothetical protein